MSRYEWMLTINRSREWNEADHPRDELGRFVDKDEIQLPDTPLTIKLNGQVVDVVEKGGPGSGNWGHAGRPGLVGGSALGGRLLSELSHAPDALYERYGIDKPSVEEEKKFIDAIDAINEDVKSLWPEDGKPPILAKARDNWTAYHQGLWVVVPSDSVDGPAAQHEFIHHLVKTAFGNERNVTAKLARYNPRVMFAHAENAVNQKNEDLTMMLDFYDSDPQKWAQNIKGAGELYKHTPFMHDRLIQEKIDEVNHFLNRNTEGWFLK